MRIEEVIGQGRRHHSDGDLDAAESCYRRVLEAEPGNADALHLSGLIALQRGDPQSAETLLRQAIGADGERAEFHCHLGNMLVSRGKIDKAEESYRRALEIEPEYADAHSNLGNLLKRRNDTTAAEKAYRRAIAINPGHADAHGNLGNLLRDQKRWDEAERCINRALEINPRHVNALVAMGNVLADRGEWDQAERFYRRALAIAPASAIVHANLGRIEMIRGAFDEAERLYDRALELNPSYAEARFGRSLLALLKGDYRNGWQGYEDRSSVMDKVPRQAFSQPKWGGDDLQNRTLLLVADGGTGDTLQFVRYVPQVAAKGGRIVLTVQHSLVELLRRNEVAPTILGQDDPLPPYDVYCPLMSLPRLFSTTVETIPSQIPDLAADPKRATHWRNRLAGFDGLKVGVVWAGNPVHSNDRNRSIPLARLTPLLDVPGIHFFSLQRGKRPGDAETLSAIGPITDLGPELSDFAVTAAVVSALDLVISVDTAVAHLAGALGAPAWVLLPLAPDWRWLLDREDSPWYPSVRLFRQPSPGDWDTVITRVRARLVPLVNGVPGSTVEVKDRGGVQSRTKPDSRQTTNEGAAEEREKRYIRTLAHNPAERVSLRGIDALYSGRGKPERSLPFWQAAVDRVPEDLGIRFSYALALAKAGRDSDSIEQYERILEIDPNYIPALINLAARAARTGDVRRSIELYERALATKPDAAIHSNLGNVYKDLGRAEESLEHYRRAVELDPTFLPAQSNLLFAYHYVPSIDPKVVFEEHTRRGRIIAGDGLRPTPVVRDRDPGRPLRVGYLSPDLRTHPVAFFIAPLLAAHDRAGFIPVVYSGTANPDDTTARLKGSVDLWREVRKLSDADLYERIRQDEIDILVELSGHTASNRLALMARRPAPVQVTYLGYPNTTGIPGIGFRVTDRWADPPGVADDLASEALIRLPLGFLCYQPPYDLPDVGPVPMITTGHITFASFNNIAKTHPDVIATWAEILHAVPGSRLHLKSRLFADASTRDYFVEAFVGHGIGAERVALLRATATVAEHLERYNQVDIALDTFPYNGATTTCEALVMGVPVVTLAGHSHVARVGVSLLSSHGLAETIADDRDDYVTRAVALAGDVETLAAYRATMRERFLAAPVSDPVRFTRSAEDAYREMWKTFCTNPN